MGGRAERQRTITCVDMSAYVCACSTCLSKCVRVLVINSVFVRVCSSRALACEGEAARVLPLLLLLLLLFLFLLLPLPLLLLLLLLTATATATTTATATAIATATATAATATTTTVGTPTKRGQDEIMARVREGKSACTKKKR